MPAEKKIKKGKEEKEERARPVYVKREPEETLIEWTAPARPFKRRNREFWVTIIAIVAVSGLVLFLIEGVMPVILIISLVFLFYILTTVEPDKIRYAITTRGVKIADKRTDWDMINRFWFGRRFESRLLVFETLSLPGRLELVVDNADREKIRKKVKEYVPEEKASPSYLDKATEWFAKKMPQ